MSVIHDALSRTKQPAVSPLQVFPARGRTHVLQETQHHQAVRVFVAERRRSGGQAWQIFGFLFLVLFLGGALVTALLEKNTPEKGSLPEPLPAAVPAVLPTPEIQEAQKTSELPPVLKLSGIVDAPDPMAVINDRAVKEGDLIERARVRDIQARQVTLEFEGTEIVLIL